METPPYLLLLLCAVPLLLVGVGAQDPTPEPTLPSYTWADWTALDEYVHHDDGKFSWTVIDSIRLTGVWMHIINMTCCDWLAGQGKSDHELWFHYMGIAVPDVIKYPNEGWLLIAGGNNDDDPPTNRANAFNIGAGMFAEESGTIGAYILQVPNGPIHMYNDPTERLTGDELIAWTFHTYLEEENPTQEMLMRMPMTKGPKRALDTISEWSLANKGNTIDNFFVWGASKRGWSTWSLAAVDPRVKYFAPLVFSLLNMKQTMMKHYQSLGGFWSWALKDYYFANLTMNMYNPKINEITDVEDMYRYRARFATTPKLVISATGDEFFFFSDHLNWWDDMPEPKWLMQNQNADHILFPHYREIWDTVQGFYQTQLESGVMPQVVWELTHDAANGYVTLRTDTTPVNITGWSSTNREEDNNRDWRLVTGWPDQHAHIAGWHEEPVIEVPAQNGYQHEYVMTSPVPVEAGRYTSFFIKGTWMTASGHVMELTSTVNTVPDSFPVGPCLTDEECYSTLI